MPAIFSSHTFYTDSVFSFALVNFAFQSLVHGPAHVINYL